MSEEHLPAAKVYSLGDAVLTAFFGFCLGIPVAYAVFSLTAALVHVFLPSFRQEGGPYGAPVHIDRIGQMLHAVPVGCLAVTARLFLKRWTPFSVAFATACLMLGLLIAFRK